MQEVRDALADGSLSRKTLERNIRNTMRLILQTYFFDGDKEALEVYNLSMSFPSLRLMASS